MGCHFMVAISGIDGTIDLRRLSYLEDERLDKW